MKGQIMLAFTSSDFIGYGITPNDIFLNSKPALNLTELELKVKLRAAATEPTQSLGFCQSSHQVTNVFATYATQEPFASTQGHVAAQKATGVAIMEPPVSPRRETQARCAGSDRVATQGTFGAADEGADASQSNCRTTVVSATQASGDAIIGDADVSTSTGLKAEVEARLRWARKGWKWGMAQFWRNTGRKTVKGVRIPPSLKFSLGREQMAHEAVFFADMLPLTKLAEVIERLRDETRPWYRGLYNGLVDLYGSDPKDKLFGVLRAANERGAKGPYVPGSFAMLDTSEAITQVLLDGMELVLPMRSFPARQPNAADWKGFWNGFGKDGSGE